MNHHPVKHAADPSGLSADRLSKPILIVGAPRSGTTWLAKIIDSHPEVIYRHEPDETRPAGASLTAAEVPGLLADWADDRSPRTAGKQPFFPKAWQSAPARILRTLFANTTAAAARMPPPIRRVASCRLPDLATRPAPRIAMKSIRLAERAAVLSEALPGSRTIFILRHPCGQVASVMRGNRQRRFDLRTAGTDMPFDEARAVAHAAAQGTDGRTFDALPDAAKYAWSWRAYNEPAYAALGQRGNVLVVLYEALCLSPDALARRIMAFTGLDWNAQTASFVARSTTHQAAPGYFAVFRNAVAAAESWRRTMPPSDQAAVQSVVAASPLARFWPDL